MDSRTTLLINFSVKVAGLVMDNDFGLAYELGFEAYAEGKLDIVVEYLPVRHDPAAPTVTNEVTTIAAFDPDVFISMTAGNPCLLATQEVEASGLLDLGFGLPSRHHLRGYCRLHDACGNGS